MDWQHAIDMVQSLHRVSSPFSHSRLFYRLNFFNAHGRKFYEIVHLSLLMYYLFILKPRSKHLWKPLYPNIFSLGGDIHCLNLMMWEILKISKKYPSIIFKLKWLRFQRRALFVCKPVISSWWLYFYAGSLSLFLLFLFSCFFF